MVERLKVSRVSQHSGAALHRTAPHRTWGITSRRVRVPCLVSMRWPPVSWSATKNYVSTKYLWMHPSHMSASDFSPILYLLHFLKVQARSLYVVWPAEKGVTSCLPEDHLTCRNILSLPCHIHTHKKYCLLETLNLSGYTDSSTNNKNKTPNYGNTKKKVYLYKEVPQIENFSVCGTSL